MKRKFLTFAAAALAFGALSAGEVLFEETFADAESTAKNWGQAGVAAFTADGFENGGLKIANDNPKGARLLPIKIDAAKVRGKKLKVTSMVRGENVSKPGKPYLGVKAMIYYKAASGDRQWIEHKPKKDGTFGWEEVVTQADIPADAEDVSFQVGLQESSGTVWFDDIKADIVE